MSRYPIANIAIAALIAGSLAIAAPAYAENTTAASITFQQVTKAALNFTKVTEYGTSMPDLLAGKVTPPAQGARFDVFVEGKLSGLIDGKMTGTDYINVRSDGRFELNVFAEILTDDGVRISYEGHGVSVPQADGTARMRQSVKLVTGDNKYAWVNGLTLIAEGAVNPAAGQVSMTLLK